MIFFISRAQDIDNVILMQSMGNVSFDILHKLTVCMCENRFQQNHLMKNWIQKIKQIWQKIGSKHVLTYFAGNTSQGKGPKKSTQYDGKKYISCV